MLQVLAHAGLPLLRLSWPEDGGELGRAGRALAAAAPIALLAVVGTAWAVEPPTVHLAAGIHQGPLVLDHAQTVTGEPGTIVRGGIVITADDVTVRNVTVRGGEYGIDVEHADSVELEDVVVEGAELDGIHVRRGQVEIRDCTIRSLPGAYTQGIDISFGFDLKPSLVERCTVVGGLEGIVTHFALVMIRDNHVSNTELRAITMTEMSMGKIEDNEVDGALGVGIFCGDYSHCEIEDNAVSDVRPDHRVGRLHAPGRRDPGALRRRGGARRQRGRPQPGRDRRVRRRDDRPRRVSPARLQLIARTGHPDFLDLPWDEPLAEWTSDRLVEVVRGIHRHVVRFVEYDSPLGPGDLRAEGAAGADRAARVRAAARRSPPRRCRSWTRSESSPSAAKGSRRS